MTPLNRRTWIQKSLLASTAVFLTSYTQNLNAVVRTIDDPDHPLLRLNWNENPFGPSEKAVAAITDVLISANRYPDAWIRAFKEKLAKKNALKPEEVLITAGSTEVLSLLGQHVGLNQGEILTPWPSFPTLMEFGKVCGAKVREVPLDGHETIDLDAIKDAINNHTSLIFICNPNNPTSTEIANNDHLKSFCRSIPENILICVDEAYIEYSRNGIQGSLAGLIHELPNLLVCRTFSKAYGLAGMRIGYALSQKPNIEALSKRHIGFEMSVGVAPIAAAEACLDDQEFLKFCIHKNQEGRQILYQAFNKWGVPYNRSSTNFVYAKSHPFDPQVVQKLRAEKILISQWKDIMAGHIRISVGKPHEMSQFVSAMEKFLI